MHRQMTVAQQLTLGFGLLLALLLLIALFAWRSLSQSDAAMKTLYEDRTLPMQQLGDIRFLLARDRILLTDAAANPNPAKTEKRLTEFDKNRAKAKADWEAYMATYLTPEEAQLAEQQRVAMQAYLTDGLLPAAKALRRQDFGAAFKAQPALG